MRQKHAVEEAVEEADESNFELGEPEEDGNFEEGGELQDPFEEDSSDN